MEDYKAELDRRRNRGRLAQSAFRKRQAEAKEKIIKENANLKQAIGAILGEVQQNDRSALRAKIQEAATLAGLAHGKPNDVSSHVLDPSKLTPVDRVCSGKETSESTPRSKQVLSIQPTTRSHGNNHMSIRPDPFHCHQCTNGIATVLPFLGSGAFTFAGRIFWHLVEKFEMVKDSRGPLQLPEPPFSVELSPAPKFLDLFDQSASLQQMDSSQWVSLIEERLASSRSEFAYNDTSLQKPLITHDAAPPEQSASYYLSPISAENRIRAIVGDDVFAVLAAPVIHRWEAKGKNQEILDKPEFIDSFLDTLSNSYVCFGDGPRWDRRKFDSALRSWCFSIINTGVTLNIGKGGETGLEGMFLG